ncbi:MAG TPA: AarF/ABC1/UbiB kinase family protein [Lacipirellulaceae bacterium]|nr:AarF/ABC1/UbiB kinase family protein [Lacipirellulaceae bacterium]
MRIRTIPQVYRNVNRWREILAVLTKYGLAGWLSRLRLSAPLRTFFKPAPANLPANATREMRIRLALEELGPTFIKLGQVMSTRPDLVGAELAEELEKLQTAVPADPPEAVAELILEDLGRPISSVFQSFCETPVASASIGQVHRARLHTGEDVAVKVQRRHIGRVVRVDLDILQGLAQLAERLPDLEGYRPCAAVAEFQRALRRELDFDRERRHMDEFRRRFDGSELVRIPRPYPELSTDRVLVMEWLEGVPLSSPKAIAASGIDLAAVARHGAELYLDMIFRHGLYHADPHPGNLLLMDNEAIGLLDYGMVGRIDDGLREDIEELLMAIVDQDSQRLGAIVTRVGSTPPGLDESSLNVDLADFVAHYGHQPVERFELADALREMTAIVRRHRIVLPASMTMLLKVLVMLEGAGRRLNPNFSLVEVLKPYRAKMLARRLSPTRQFRKARRIAYEIEQLAEVFPRRLRDILQQVQAGRFDVHLDHRGLEPSVNRLVLGMLTSALFLGSVLLVTNDVLPLGFWPLGGVSAPGLLGITLSAALGLRILRAINKSGHLDRR